MRERGPELDWTFGGSWPHEPSWFESADGVMHYVDVGPRDGRPVVLVHGNPTWGYLFRSFIPALAEAGHRVIVPDHLGFGRSAKPGGAQVYAVQRHARRFADLLDSLDVSGVLLVPHDWGGPISLSWAAAQADRVAGLFILNTLAHELGGSQRLKAPLPLRLFRAPGLGELLVQGCDAFKPAMFRLSIERPQGLTAEARHAYRAVHRGWSKRAGMLAFARQLPLRAGGPVNAMNRETELRLRDGFRSKPVRIVWGDRDRVLSPGLLETAWLETLPGAEVSRLPDAGHFLQEDAPEAVVGSLLEFAERL